MYSKPRTIEQALSIRSSGKVLVVCGGTDVYPAHADRPFADPVLDLSDIESLRGISRAGGIFRIGAAATWTDVISAPLPAGFDGLKAAAREVGSLQIQNRGTVAGNICNASPAADGIPPLLSLDASVELQSLRGQRLMPLSEFVTGYRRTALAPDEIVSAILVPAPAGSARSSFVKLGARRYLVISILMAAALMEWDDEGTLARASIAVGSASPVASRLNKLEQDLVGLPSGTRPSSILDASHLQPLSPIDDVRATAVYRLDAGLSVIGQALDAAWERSVHEQ